MGAPASKMAGELSVCCEKQEELGRISSYDQVREDDESSCLMEQEKMGCENKHRNEPYSSLKLKNLFVGI